MLFCFYDKITIVPFASFKLKKKKFYFHCVSERMGFFFLKKKEGHFIISLDINFYICLDQISNMCGSNIASFCNNSCIKRFICISDFSACQI